jgi:hypothetical protein
MIFQENDFLKTYNEVDALWGSSEADLGGLNKAINKDSLSEDFKTLDELEQRLKNFAVEFDSVINQLKNNFEVSTLFLFKSCRILAPENFLGVCFKDRIQWSPEARKSGGTNLSSSWVGFDFILKDFNANLAVVQSLAESLTDYMELNALYEVRKPKTSKFMQGFTSDVYSICLPLSTSASLATLNSVYNDIAFKLEDLVLGAATFLTDFKQWTEHDFKSILGDTSKVSTVQDFQQLACYIPDLYEYYLSHHSDLKCMGNFQAFLSLFGCKLHGEKKSLQYLYNAGLQEDLIEAAGLVRNPEATRVYSAPSKTMGYHYLVAKNSNIGAITDKSDFIFKDDYKVDAKIYGSVSSMWKYLKGSTGSTHDAQFLIVYIKAQNIWGLLYYSELEKTWKVFKVKDKLEDCPKVAFELNNKVIGLSKNSLRDIMW